MSETREMDWITIKLQRRGDGGLRVCSDDVPGLVLSHSDPARVMSDVMPALEVLCPAIRQSKEPVE